MNFVIPFRRIAVKSYVYRSKGKVTRGHPLTFPHAVQPGYCGIFITFWLMKHCLIKRKTHACTSSDAYAIVLACIVEQAWEMEETEQMPRCKSWLNRVGCYTIVQLVCGHTDATKASKSYKKETHSCCVLRDDHLRNAFQLASTHLSRASFSWCSSKLVETSIRLV